MYCFSNFSFKQTTIRPCSTTIVILGHKYDPKNAMLTMLDDDTGSNRSEKYFQQQVMESELFFKTGGRRSLERIRVGNRSSFFRCVEIGFFMEALFYAKLGLHGFEVGVARCKF